MPACQEDYRSTGSPAVNARPSLEHMYEQARLSALIEQAPRPPMVSAVLGEGQIQAALLVWGRTPQGLWVAGVAYLHRTWHDRALVTTWLPATSLAPHPSYDYQQVPRVRLPGDPARWPSLPPRYPHAGPEWIAAHRHDPYGTALR